MSSISMERVIDVLFAREKIVKDRGQVTDNADFMRSLCEIHELKHAPYITADKRSLISRRPKFYETYPSEWLEEYRRSFAEQKDQVMQAGLSETLNFVGRIQESVEAPGHAYRSRLPGAALRGGVNIMWHQNTGSSDE